MLCAAVLLSGCGAPSVVVGVNPNLENNIFAEGINRILEDFREQTNNPDQNKILDASGFADEFKDLSDVNADSSYGYEWVQSGHYINSPVFATTFSFEGSGTDSVNLG